MEFETSLFSTVYSCEIPILLLNTNFLFQSCFPIANFIDFSFSVNIHNLLIYSTTFFISSLIFNQDVLSVIQENYFKTSVVVMHMSILLTPTSLIWHFWKL